MQTQIRDLAARFARGLPEFSLTLSSEGAGNAGRRCAAAKSVHVVTTVTPESPGIPRAMVYGLLRALPGDRALLPPSPAGPTASLTPASRCQDHTTWPPQQDRPSRALLRPPHPAPTSVTFAKRPSEWNGMRRI